MILCTPATLEQAPCFVDVTSEVVEQQIAPKNSESMHALDGDSHERASLRQAIIFDKYFQSIKADLHSLCRQNNIAMPQTFFDALKFINDLFRSASVGRFTESTPLLVEARQLDKRLKVLIDSGELLALLDILKKQDDITHRQMSDAFENDVSYIQRLEEYLRMTQQSLTHKRALRESVGYAYSEALQAILRIERASMSAYVQRERIVSELLDRAKL